MPRYHNINGENVQFTDAEETARDVEEKDWADSAFSRKIEEVREKRDRLLTETDWWGTSDNTMTNAQTAYRKALRDYPATYTADNSADWPTKP